MAMGISSIEASENGIETPIFIIEFFFFFLVILDMWLLLSFYTIQLKRAFTFQLENSNWLTMHKHNSPDKMNDLHGNSYEWKWNNECRRYMQQWPLNHRLNQQQQKTPLKLAVCVHRPLTFTCWAYGNIWTWKWKIKIRWLWVEWNIFSNVVIICSICIFFCLFYAIARHLSWFTQNMGIHLVWVCYMPCIADSLSV